MERKIGEKFTDNGVELEVVKEEDKGNCVGCHYNTPEIGCTKNEKYVGSCTFCFRQDGEDIIFKEVEKCTTNELG